MSLASARLGSQWLALRLARRLLMSLCSGSAMDCGGGKQVLYIIIHWPYHYLVAYLALLICLGVFILSYINFIFIGIGKLQVYQVHQSNGNGRVCLRLWLVSGKPKTMFSPPQSPRHLYSFQHCYKTLFIWSPSAPSTLFWLGPNFPSRHDT